MERRKYENKMVGRPKNRPAISSTPEKKVKSTSVLVEVIREHDGIKVGEVLRKPKDIATWMIEKGYYKQVE